MLRLLRFVWAALVPFFLTAQDGLEPPFDISPSIAKLAERSDFQGNWLRGDGGYRIAIEVNPDFPGGVSAGYFNPDPINVESSSFDSDAEVPVLVIVLRDEGYPGSIYELRYLAERAVLVGSYARSGSQPSEVYFVKQVKD